MNRKKLLLSTLLLITPFCSFAEETTLASVNGVAITDAEVQHFITKLQQPVPTERALQEMINVEILVQQAKNDGMMKDQDLQLEIKRISNGLIASHFLQKQLLKLDLSPQILKQRYQQDYVDSKRNKEYNANHILLKTEAEANDVINQLNQGSSFSELAKTLSTGPSGENGGALGWFESSAMVPAFSQATMKLQPGQYSSQPVKTQFGWHVILLNEIRDIEPPSFESVKKELSSAIAGEYIQKIMRELKQSANIQIPAR